MSNYDPYEQDRENNAVGPDDDGRYDLGEIGDDGPTPEHYGDSMEDGYYAYTSTVTYEGPQEDIINAAKQYNARSNSQFLFFMDAMKRSGVL